MAIARKTGTIREVLAIDQARQSCEEAFSILIAAHPLLG
jgi:hypothetical protein